MGLKSLVLFFLTLTLVNGDPRKCYNPDRDFYTSRGTHTAYEFVRGSIKPPTSSCEPVQIWMLARHGTRYPGRNLAKKLLSLTNVRDEIIKNHEDGRGELCSSDLDKLKKWLPDSALGHQMLDQNLTTQGYKDHFELAKRLKDAYPTLLKIDPKDVKPGDYIFRSTDTQRTKASLDAFTEGLFGKNHAVAPEKIPQNDSLLHLYDKCPSYWSTDGKKDSYEDLIKESNQFKSGLEVQRLLANLTKRLGYNQTLDYDKVSLMFKMCTLEAAWYVTRDSAWCALFNEEDGKVFEYVEDLKYYYRSGPGRDDSRRLGCLTINDLFDHFKKLETGDKQPKGVFYFSHTVTLQALMSSLNVGKDVTPITRNNFNTSDSRNYHVSRIGAFATNVVAVFYRCRNRFLSNKVIFYVAEKKLNFPECREELCDWSYIKDTFGPLTEGCSTDFCHKSEPTPIVSNSTVAVASAAVAIPRIKEY